MRKTLILLAAAAAALTSTIGMAQEGERRFIYEGKTYVYTTVAAKGDRVVIEGRRFPTGEAFHLVVRNNRVSGVSGGVPVSFTIAQAKGAAAGVETASN